jgi:hypothetical protein
VEREAGRFRSQYLPPHAERTLAASEFDYLQDEFLSRRHRVDKFQDVREREGITTANAHIGQGIRDGIQEMRELLGKLQEEERRLIKKKVGLAPRRRTRLKCSNARVRSSATARTCSKTSRIARTATSRRTSVN